MKTRITRKVSCGKVIGDKWEWASSAIKKECQNRRRPICIRIFGEEKTIKRSEVSEYKLRGFKPYIKDFIE